MCEKMIVLGTILAYVCRYYAMRSTTRTIVLLRSGDVLLRSSCVQIIHHTGISPIYLVCVCIFAPQHNVAKVMNEFQSKHLKEEWEKRQRAILASRNKRIAEDERRRVGLEQELNVFRAQNADVQAKLDAKIDSASARFADLQVELRYEADRVEKKLGQGGPRGAAGGAAPPCVELRSELAACFREADDVRRCDGYVEALERCVKVEVVKQ